MELQGGNTLQNQEPAAVSPPVTKTSLGLGAAVLAGLVVAAGIAAPAPMNQQASPLPFNVAETGQATTCCPPLPGLIS